MKTVLRIAALIFLAAYLIAVASYAEAATQVGNECLVPLGVFVSDVIPEDIKFRSRSNVICVGIYGNTRARKLQNGFTLPYQLENEFTLPRNVKCTNRLVIRPVYRTPLRFSIGDNCEITFAD